MIALRTVLCPVDFSPATSRQVELAADLCRAFGARLVLHHNRHSLGAVASVGWMWNAEHHGDSLTVVEAKLRDCLTCVPHGVSAEHLMTEGPASLSVLGVLLTVWVVRRGRALRTPRDFFRPAWLRTDARPQP